ncbi:branched-chain amino acid aminotransferase [Salipaludibacillus aurantiacus]|uniref:Branched-chain-amino-acid aminotransferase n=1 Tax=Salipaludibacillus aurantiacus TaxID=1601833 RepID=A0A1H9VTB8_9BACI|nr:branched-chain amino acid aminotransferase [Salipaludibacillus aurantiacus]SES24533.1 branched-chain amino acid aminotransferase [Salipaludibacillus aurantiacus]
MIEAKLDIVENQNKKPKPEGDDLPFGQVFTDHMFTMEYTREKGWFQPQIVPYEPITLDPAAMIFHYGQSVFEGLKAYLNSEGDIQLFRPEENLKRMNRSNGRMSIPPISEELVINYLKQLLLLEKEWIPNEEGRSLYIRPFVIATEANLAVAPSQSYKFMIILSPVGSYYPEGIHPVSIQVEEHFTRAVRGGTGTAKTGGNYCGGYKAQEKAADRGHAQVMWLDGVHKKYIEEVGSMNVFFKINGQIITPELNDSILEGVTRKSIIELLKHWNIDVIERKISMEELLQAYEDGQLEEAFGAGTAAVVSPIGELSWQDETMIINGRQTGDLTKFLYNTITGIQTGKLPDTFNWTETVKEL